MSSPSRTWSERAWSERAAALVAGVLAALVALFACVPAAAAAAPVPLRVVTTLPGSDGRSLLVLDLSAAPGAGEPAVTVEQDGTPLVSTLTPVVGETMGVTLVVDNSTDGAAEVPAWLSAGARFILEAPAQARAVVVTASAPAAVATGPEQGPVEIVRALEAVRAGGERDTSAALALASDQFPDIGPGHKVVVLYTSAPDAGGASAAALAARFRARGQLLVVVGPAAAEGFWGAAATGTGGFFAPAGDPVVVPALDQVRTTLQSRYLVEIPTPQRLPATLSVAVDVDGVALRGQAVIAAPPATPDEDPAVPVAVWWTVAAVGVLALAAIAFFLVRRGRTGGPAVTGPASVGPASIGPASIGPASVGPASMGSARARPAIAGPPAALESAPGAPDPAEQAPAADSGAAAAVPTAFNVKPRPAPGVPDIARGRASLPHDPGEDIARGRASVPPPTGRGGAAPRDDESR